MIPGIFISFDTWSGCIKSYVLFQGVENQVRWSLNELIDRSVISELSREIRKFSKLYQTMLSK